MTYKQVLNAAIAELSVEGVRPDIDVDAPSMLIESELHDLMCLYLGRDVADEWQRRLEIADVHTAGYVPVAA